MYKAYNYLHTQTKKSMKRTLKTTEVKAPWETNQYIKYSVGVPKALSLTLAETALYLQCLDGSWCHRSTEKTKRIRESDGWFCTNYSQLAQDTTCGRAVVRRALSGLVSKRAIDRVVNGNDIYIRIREVPVQVLDETRKIRAKRYSMSEKMFDIDGSFSKECRALVSSSGKTKKKRAPSKVQETDHKCSPPTPSDPDHISPLFALPPDHISPPN